MKKNRKKIMAIGVVVTLLIATNLVVSASYIQERSTTNQLRKRVDNNDNKMPILNTKNTPLDLLFEGVTQAHALKNESFQKTPRPWKGEQTALKSCTHENTPLDLLFNNVTQDSPLKAKKQVSKKGTISLGRLPGAAVKNRQQYHATNKNTPLDRLFNGVTLNSCGEKISI